MMYRNVTRVENVMALKWKMVLGTTRVLNLYQVSWFIEIRSTFHGIKIVKYWHG